MALFIYMGNAINSQTAPAGRRGTWATLRGCDSALGAPSPPELIKRSSSTKRLSMKPNARYVTVSNFDDQCFEASLGNERLAADDLADAPVQPYVLLQRQFEDEDGGVCYLETHEPDRYAGHLRLRLVEFTPTRLAFEIDGPQDRLVEVTFRLGARRFREVQRVVNIIFGLSLSYGRHFGASVGAVTSAFDRRVLNEAG